MKKIKDIISKINKKTLIIILGVVVALVLVIILVCTLTKGKSQEAKLTDKMEEMAAVFYKDFYYNQLGSNDEERIEFVKKYENMGLKINLDNLSRYNNDNSEEVLKEFVNKKTGKECDKYQTQAIIYPQEPFNNTSFKIEVELECGFKK